MATDINEMIDLIYSEPLSPDPITKKYTTSSPHRRNPNKCDAALEGDGIQTGCTNIERPYGTCLDKPN